MRIMVATLAFSRAKGGWAVSSGCVAMKLSSAAPANIAAATVYCKKIR